tara:strand:- start:495 stop:689 length:195 start_codon:yes stop_codon:yes gene_type:complete
MKNILKYKLARIVQLVALFSLPVIIYSYWIEPYSLENNILIGIDGAVWLHFLDLARKGLPTKKV